MLRNLVVCYSITTELKPKCPTCTQLMSFLALRKKTWERSDLSHNVLPIGNHEKNAHFHLRVALLFARNSASEVLLFCASSLSRNKSSDKLITFFGLARLDPRLDSRLLRLDPRYSMHASFEDRGSRLERDCQLTFERYCTNAIDHV